MSSEQKAGVDVLAVIDAAAMSAYQRGHLTGDKHFPGVREYEQARAAVAELIEAAGLVRDALAGPDGVSVALFDRLAASLSRVGGGS